MGYLKRKRTKRRGKKGTKKYRGGASIMSSGSNGKNTTETVEPPPGNAGAAGNAGADQKLEAKKNLDEKMTALKTLYGEGPASKAEIETIKGAMSEVSEALDAYKSFLE